MPKSKLTLIAVVVLALGLAVGIGVSVGGEDEAAAPSADSSGADGPAVDAEFTYFDGSAGALSDFRGQPLVVNFWASWCPACVAEMPDFEEVHQRFEGEVAFLGLNMQEVDKDAALDLVDQTGVTYHLAEDPQGAIYQQFGGIAMPTTVFIDADGRVVETHAGTLFAEDLEEIIRTELLG